VHTLGFVGALTLGVVLLTSGLGKLQDLSGFVIAVLEYEVLPRPLAILYARTLPVAEVACGLALVAGVLPVAVGAVAAVLLVSFLVGVSINLARGRELDCHCFGVGSSEPLGWMTLARIGALLMCVAATMAWRGSGMFALPSREIIPAALLALGILLLLYLVRAIPIQSNIWRITAPAEWKEPRRGRMVSFRNYPLTARPAPTVSSGGASE